MEWIKGIQRAVDYIEAHLTDEIDYDEVAKEAYSSEFHFQRVFSVMCGYTVGDYIRMRRLSCAAEELLRGGEKIIDVALRYGYDTPESFSRAFTRFHGITPSEAKRGGQVKSFSRLSVKLILTGGRTMDYRIEKLDAFKIVCRRAQVNKPASATATEDISAFWDRCRGDGTLKKLIGCVPKNETPDGLLGVCFSCDIEASKFPYAIGAKYDGRPLNDEFEIVEIPAHTYAVFTSHGKMPEAFVETYTRIVSEFFPQSTKYEYGEGVELEVYPSDDTSDPNFECEIWIAVNEK